MKKIQVFDKKIPVKNYVIVLGVSILIIIFTLYARSLYLLYNSYSNNESYFTYKKVNQATKDDFEFIFTEATNDILYIGYSSNKLYSLEKKLFKEFEKNDLLDKVIYWNVDDYLNNNEYITILKSKFPEIEIYNAPSIIIITNGVASESLKVDEELIKNKKIKELSERNQLN